MKTRRICAAALLATLAIGCGDSGPALVAVHGVVTLNGKPLEGAAVTFLPDPASPGGLPAEDVTGPDGNYKAMTSGRSGVVPGKYKVMVTKSFADPSAAASASFQDDPFMAQMGSEVVTPRKKGAAPEKIDALFDREVTAEGGQIDMDVKAKASDVPK